jgi:hypothetical protein
MAALLIEARAAAAAARLAGQPALEPAVLEDLRSSATIGGPHE